MGLFSFLKGKTGEIATNIALDFKLNENYTIHKNITLKYNDMTTQIDHIVVSRYGVFVIETKNKDGWIFGNEKSKHWTQSIYGNKYKFYNPIKQNYKHIKYLSYVLDKKTDIFKSIICFVGDCEIRTELPSYVLDRGLSTYIKSFKVPLLDAKEIADINYKIKHKSLKKSFKTDREHVKNIKRSINENLCPNCGAKMVLREAKRGNNPGNKFWGCSKYPKCRGARSL